MKLWQKLYVFTTILFIVVLNFAGVFLIEKNFDISIKSEVNRSYNEQSTINSGMEISYPAYKTLGRYMEDSSINSKIVYRFAEDYTNKTNDIYIEVLDMDNQKIYSNLDIKMPEKREELQFSKYGERRGILRDIGDRTFIFISNIIHVNNENYKMTFARELTNVYTHRKESYLFFIKAEIFLIFIFSLFMFFITKFISKPINHMMKITQKISDGDYDARVDFTSKDELGVLAGNLNLMADAIEKNIIKLEKVNQQKEQFIESFTHELKTPLTTIIGFANLLRTTKFNEKTYIEAIDFIYYEGKRLEALSIDLMDLIVLDKHEYNMKQENFRKLLADTKTAMSIKLEAKNIDLILNCEDVNMKMEINLMRLLISNLIDNSIKASHEGNKIIVSIYKNMHEIILSIQDFGIGIPKEHIKDVLEPFYMVDKARTRANNGAGLGLSICKKIVDIHQGKMEIYSEENIGTTITVTFLGKEGDKDA